MTDDCRVQINTALNREGQAALSLSRASQGGITLKISTHAFGTIQLALTDATFTDLMFGLSETVVPIARVLPNRCPSYPRPSPI